MDSKVLPAIVSSVCTLIATVVAAILVHTRKMRKSTNDSTVSNFQVLYTEMRTEIDRMRDEQREERKQWAEERKQFNQKITGLQSELRKQDTLLHKKELTVTELKGKIELLTVQLESYRQSQPSNAKVNITT